MLTFKFHLVIFLSLLPVIVLSLPVAEDTRIKTFAVDEPESDSSSTYPASRSLPDPLIRSADDQISSSESSPEDSFSSIASALRLSSSAAEGKVGLKRDDVRKYDTPRPWSYEEYRPIYLAGLARIASEAGNKIKGKRYPSDLEPDSLSSKARSAKKRESQNKSDVPVSKDGNESSMVTDNYGLTFEDYRNFYEHNLNEDYPQWTLEDWQNFQNRYLEFVASGGQVGKGGHKRGDMWKYNNLYDFKSGYSSQNCHMLKEWLRRNGLPKQHKPQQRTGHQKRDNVHQYDSSMYDEDGRGGLVDEKISRWETILDLEVWARVNGHLAKHKRSQDLKIAQESLNTAPNAAAREIQGQLPQQMLLPANQPSMSSAADGSNINGDSVHQISRNFFDKTLTILSQGMWYLYSSCLSPLQKLGIGSGKLHRKQSWAPSMRQNSHRRDDIRKYGDYLTDTEWSRLWAASTALEANSLLEEAEKPKTKRDADPQYGGDDGFEQFTAKDKEELHKSAMADPAFLEFQRQYLAQKVQKRLPSAPGIQQTAPIHKELPPADTENDASGSGSSSADSTMGPFSSSKHPPSKTKIQSPQKRNLIQWHKDLDSEGEDELHGINDAHVIETPEPILHERKGLQQRSQTGPTPVPDLADGRSIAEIIAAEEASDLPEEASDQEKRDNMYRYGGGLDDYDDYVLSSLFCDTEECLREASNDLSQMPKRDSMDKHKPKPEEWESYSELLEAMEDGRVLSFRSKAHPRDLSNFPSWIPSENPAPPQIRPEAASKKGKRDNKVRQSGLSNFPSWAPAENPAPPNTGDGIGSSKREKRNSVNKDLDAWLSESQDGEGDALRDAMAPQWSISQPSRRDSSYPELQKSSLVEALGEDGYVAKTKRDKVDQYDRNMADEDEWIDIYRLYYTQRQRAHQHSSNVNGKRKLRRAPQPEPEPEPDTVVVRPIPMGLTELAQPTTVQGGSVGSITSLLSLVGASPGPGTLRRQAPAAAPSPTSSHLPDLSAVFYPFGPLLPVGPSQHSVPVDRRRREASADAPADRDDIDQWPIRQHANNAGRVPPIERRTPTPTVSMQGTMTRVASSESQTQSASPTKVQYPDGAAPPPDIPANLSDVVQDFGPLLNVASALTTTSTASRLPSVGSTTGTNATSSNKAKRDSIAHYSHSSSVQDFSDEDWDSLDNYITFQEAEEPEKRQASSCLEYDADPSQNILEPGCLCGGSTKALPTLEGPNPCAYTSVPKIRARRDDETKYKLDKEGDDAIYRWVPTGRMRSDGNGLKERRESMPRDNTAAEQEQNGGNSTEQGGQQAADQNAVSDQQEEQEQEQQQQQEGAEQAKMEQGGQKERRRPWQWVPEEEELTEGMPEGSGHDKAKRVRLPITTEGGGVKRHCGRSDLPQGYGSNETADLCG